MNFGDFRLVNKNICWRFNRRFSLVLVFVVFICIFFLIFVVFIGLGLRFRRSRFRGVI